MIERNEDCIICRLVNGQLPISKVYENDRVLGAMDIQPVNTGHVLIFPKTHAARLADLRPDLGAHMFKVAMEVSEALRASGVRCEEVNLLIADGEAAGQEISHVHLHVIPRFEDDGFGFRFDESYFVLPERAKLDETASEIREALPQTN
jgi:histidine triad (HIT) family protein